MKKIMLSVFVAIFSIAFVLVSNAALTEHTILPDEINAAEVSGGTENPITSGLNFSVNTPGKLTKVRLWLAEGRSGLHTVSIWDANAGTMLAGPFDWELDGEQGWSYFELPEAIDIEVDKSYGVAISDNTSTFMSAIHGYWENNEPASDVFVTYHRGFSNEINVLPSNWNSDGTYMVDVVFVTGEPEPEPTTQPPETEPENPETSDSSPILFILSVFLVSITLIFVLRRCGDAQKTY